MKSPKTTTQSKSASHMNAGGHRPGTQSPQPHQDTYAHSGPNVAGSYALQAGPAMGTKVKSDVKRQNPFHAKSRG